MAYLGVRRIQTGIVLLGQGVQEIELGGESTLFLHLQGKAGVVIGFVLPGEHVHLHAAIFVKTLGKRTDAVTGTGEVEDST